MKKPWLLIIAGVLLTTLIGLWLYLFFGGEEAKEDLYNAFGLEGDNLPFGFDDLFTDGTASSSSPYLRQISLRQTIGYVPFAATSSSSAMAYLAEAGTGHIFKVDTATGQEERLSNITIPSAKNASFSPDGNYAAVTSEDGRALTIVTLPNGSSTLESTRLDVSPISTSFTSNNTLLYAIKEGQSVKGYAYDVRQNSSRVIFSVPFREATILWGSTVEGPHYTLPKTAEELEGYLYEIKSGSMERLPISGFGLSANSSDSWVLYTKIEKSQPKSYLYEKSSGAATPIESAALPEKCLAKDGIYLCAVHKEVVSINSWYRGEYNSEDTLWFYIPEINYSSSVEDLSAATGRTIDAVTLKGVSGAFYFVNKVDGGLWVYERDFMSPLIDN